MVSFGNELTVSLKVVAAPGSSSFAGFAALLMSRRIVSSAVIKAVGSKGPVAIVGRALVNVAGRLMLSEAEIASVVGKTTTGALVVLDVRTFTTLPTLRPSCLGSMATEETAAERYAKTMGA